MANEDVRFKITAKDKTKSAFGSVGRNLKKISGFLGGLKGKVAAFIGVGAAVALFQFTKRSLAAADAIAKVADKVGVSTDTLQEFRFAAEQSGVAVTAADMALQRFDRRMGEAAKGGGVMAGVVEEYGINLEHANGQQKTTIELLKDYADVVAGAGTQSEQLLLTFKAFDSEGAALVNLMQGGAKAIEAFQREAKAAGLTIEEHLIRSAEAANDQLNKMQRVVGAQMTRLFIGLAPTIVNVGEAFARAAPKIKEFIDGFLPDELAGIDELGKRLAEIDEKIAQQERARGIARIAAIKRIAALNLEREALVNLTAAAKVRAKSFAGLLKPPPAVDTATIKIKAVVDALEFERAQLSRTAFEQRVYNELKKAGVENISEQGLAIRGMVVDLEAERLARAKLKKQNDENKTSLDRLKDGAFQFGDAFSSSFEDAILKGEKLGTVLQSLVDDLMRITLRNVVTAPLGEALQGVIGGFFTAADTLPSGTPISAVPTPLPRPGRAGGGPVDAGGAYTVGESGTELLQMGSRSGRVIPNNALGGASVINIFDYRGADAPAIETQQSRGSDGREQIAVFIRETVKRGLGNGEFDGAMRQSFSLNRSAA